MYRLSIIIPVPDALAASDSSEPAAFEETLVSVLENRPAQSQILLACDPQYDDPYDLGDEVEFVRASDKRWTFLANLALQEARGSLVHVLMPGVTVAAGWHQDACDFLARCPDGFVGASPRMEYESGSETTAGIKLTPCGRRRFLRSIHVENENDSDQVAFGPCQRTGFFRRHELLQARGWNTSIHPDAADVELALRLLGDGFRFAYCEGSVVHYQRPTASGGLTPASTFAVARDLERIYRSYNRAGVVAKRGLTASARMLAGISSDSFFGRLVGRFGSLSATGSLDTQVGAQDDGAIARDNVGDTRSRAA